MTLMLAIGIPVFLIFGGGLLAFAFAHDDGEAEPIQAAENRPAPTAHPLVFFQPTGWSDQMREASVEEIVASIEAHLKKERRAAEELALPPAA